MVAFFKGSQLNIYAVGSEEALSPTDIEKLEWLLGQAHIIPNAEVAGPYTGPRKEMITPWSTNAVEITQNMGLKGIFRMELFLSATLEESFDPMLQATYQQLDQEIFTIEHPPEPIIEVTDISQYNEEQGLALSKEEISYLEEISQELARPLTDSEVFGFSQVNSEHCRHKIFNGTFIIDGIKKEASLFQLIKKTSKDHPQNLVSAYKDNVAFIKGPTMEQFAPRSPDLPDYFETKEIDSVISLKAETHNFPTTVEPFNGASTGTGGEIRDRLAGGKASIPLAGTAVYMTPYSRLTDDRKWEQKTKARKWLYQTPLDILIKASNGASDFGNKFGQPLICGSVLTFEHEENNISFGYDKVIMLAGGIGFGRDQDSRKGLPEPGDSIVVLGGDNYRIGMGGGAVSSVATGEFGQSIELNAVQRANPEMQKRVANAIRALAEMDQNPIISIHDHGAGGHLNCLSELVEDTGGTIRIADLPLGDPTLSDKEIIGNESQERMGLVINQEDLPLLQAIADRERAPMYEVGETTDDHHLKFENKKGAAPIDWQLDHMFGQSPQTVLEDQTEERKFKQTDYDQNLLPEYLEQVLQLEAVACKDWLTNKVDRAVTGKVAMQQTAGAIQLPLNNLGITALDYLGSKGVATAIGHAPASALINAAAGSRLAIAEALTNLVWAPLTNGLEEVSLSANWMWPAKTPGEDARLYQAVQAVSDFACELGINIPTGKDSLSMRQKYPDGKTVYAPGTVIISAVGAVNDIKKAICPVLADEPGSHLVFINFAPGEMELGGSSFAQITGALGNCTPDVVDAPYFKKAFNALQSLIQKGKILAGHDISAGGIITTLLEMTFTSNHLGLKLDLSNMKQTDPIRLLFSETPGVVVQIDSIEDVSDQLKELEYHVIGQVTTERKFYLKLHNDEFSFDPDHLRDVWFKTSYLLDQHQCGPELAKERYVNYKKQDLQFDFPAHFLGSFVQYGIDPQQRLHQGLRAAIIREKGVNGDREMAYALYLAGFEVKDVHMTDLVSGRETLDDVHFIVFVGGFSNSDVLGSAKGWAGAFLFNEKAKQALDRFYQRSDTLSLGVCNGCQLMTELNIIYPDHQNHPKMLHNDSGKFESAFLNVTIQENNSVMLQSLAGARLGIWVQHGEGKFNFPYPEEEYAITAKFSYSSYPGNPNGSQFAAAAIHSQDGRHLAIMPHLERSFFPWQWAHYPAERKQDMVSPWMEAFVNARKWVKKQLDADIVKDQLDHKSV